MLSADSLASNLRDFCFLDDIKTGIARDALQNFALLSGQEDGTRGQILRASKAISRLFDCNFDSPTPQSLSVFWGKATEAPMIKAINEALCNGTSFSGRIHCYKIGARKPTWCEINIGPVHKATDGALVCFALFVRDVDVLKKGAGSMDMEEEKADQQEQSKVTRRALTSTAIIEPVEKKSKRTPGSSSTVFVFGKHGEGEGFSTMCGYKPGELPGQPLNCLYGADTASSDRRVLHRALLDHDPLSCDMLCYKKDGTPFWRHCLAVPIAGGAYITFNVNVTRARRYVGQYMTGNSIGKGSFGTVKLGMHRKTGHKVAIKRIKTEGNSRITKLVKNEIAIQQKLDSEYIANLMEVSNIQGMTYMIMELVPEGSLFERVVSKGGVSEQQTLDLFFQVAQAVEWCHLNHVCHRDLKPENMLMTVGGKVKLIDFGLSAFYKKGQKLRDVCGSKRFQAPEMTKRMSKGYDPEAVDVWSMGIVLFELFHGQIRLSQSDADSTAQYIRSYFARFSYSAEPLPGHPSKNLRDITLRMIDPDPSSRITIAELFRHDWLEEVDDLEEDEIEERLSRTAIEVQEMERKMEEAEESSGSSTGSGLAGSPARSSPSISAGHSDAVAAEPEAEDEEGDESRDKLPDIKSVKSAFCGSPSRPKKSSGTEMGRFVVGGKKKTKKSSQNRSHLSVTTATADGVVPGSTWSMVGSAYDEGCDEHGVMSPPSKTKTLSHAK